MSPLSSGCVSVQGPLAGEFTWTLTLEDLTAGTARTDLAAACDAVSAGGGGHTNLWIADLDPTTDEPADADQLAAGAGFTPYRDLWQLRAPLPLAATTDLPVRAITPPDYPAVLDVNEKAFAWHPEQGAMTADDFAARRSEDWYDPDGFFVHERDGRIAGFHWTKPHRDTDPPLGEIYVIGVDPEYHGHGIGRGLAIAGLDYLHQQGFTTALLYVESDNEAANRLYFDLGFTLHRLNRAYRRDIAATS